MSRWAQHSLWAYNLLGDCYHMCIGNSVTWRPLQHIHVSMRLYVPSIHAGMASVRLHAWPGLEPHPLLQVCWHSCCAGAAGIVCMTSVDAAFATQPPCRPSCLCSSAGEASAPEDVLWLMARAGYKPVIDSCGGMCTCCCSMLCTRLQLLICPQLFRPCPQQFTPCPQPALCPCPPSLQAQRSRALSSQAAHCSRRHRPPFPRPPLATAP